MLPFACVSERFSSVFRMARASAQVRFDSVLVGFRASRARGDARKLERAKREKNVRLGFENRPPGQSGEGPGEENRGPTGHVRAQNAARSREGFEFF